MQSAENGRFTDYARCFRRRLLEGDFPVNAHVRALVVVILYKLPENVAQLGFGEDKKIVQTLPGLFSKGVIQKWGYWNTTTKTQYNEASEY